MRRNTIVLALVALLGLAGIAAAQTYPPDLAGVQFNGYHELSFVPTEYFNVPYGVPVDPSIAWLTSIASGVIAPFPILVEIECLANANGCFMGPPAGLEFKIYEWNYDMQAYADLVVVSGGATIDAYSWRGDAWYHYTGFLDYTGSPPQFYDWGYFFLDVAVLQTNSRQPAPQADTALD